MTRPHLRGAMDPVLGKLTLEIMALRQVQEAAFTAKDVETTVNVLREMAASERQLQEKAEQALRAEAKTLLAAGPGEDPPRTSVGVMGEATQEHMRRIEALMGRLTEAIGERKAETVRRLLGMVPPLLGPGMPPGPGGFAPGPGPQPPRGGEPGAPQHFDHHQPQRGGEPGVPPPFGPVQPPQPGGPGKRGGRGPGVGPGMPWGGGPLEQGPGAAGMPGMGPQGMDIMQLVGPRMSLTELLDLMERKLSAMKK